MKRVILTGAIMMGLFLTSCNRYSYHEPSAAERDTTATVHNLNNIFN